MYKRINKIISVFCAACMMLSTFSGYASAVENTGFFNDKNSFDTSYAKIASFSNHASDLLVINIQDFHGDYNTQIAINQLLESSNSQDYDFQIYVEGAYTEVELSHYKALKNLPNFNKLMQDLLKTGKITGAEFFAISKEGKTLYGLEDKEIHEQNIKNLSYLINNRPDIVSLFDQYYEGVRSNIERTLPKKSKQLLSVRDKYINGKIDHGKFIKILNNYAKTNGLETRREYPNFYIAEKLYRSSGKINYKRVNKDLLLFENFLKSILSYKEFTRLDKTTNKMAYLGKLYRSYYFETNTLNMFFEEQYLKDNLNVAELIREEENLFWDIIDIQCENSLQRNGAYFLQTINYAKKLMLGEIFSYEYNILTQRKGDFFDSFQKYLGFTLPQSILDYYNIAKEFYRINEQRNDVFIEKAGIDKGIKTADDYNIHDLSGIFDGVSKVKILITGGYHGEGLGRILDQKGISHIVITPNIKTFNHLSKSMYEDAIAFQGGVFLSSAMQKMINLMPFLINNNKFVLENFCNILLDFEYISFFESLPSTEKALAYRIYLDELTENLNKNLPNDEKIKNINLDVSKKGDSSYTVKAVAVKENGGTIENTYESSQKIDASIPTIGDRIKGFFKKIINIFSKDKSEVSMQMLFKSIEQNRRDLEMYLRYYSENPQEDSDFIAEEILKTVNSLSANTAKLSSFDKVMTAEQKEIIHKEISIAAKSFFDIVDLSYKQGKYAKKIYRSLKKLKKILNKNKIDIDYKYENSSSDRYSKAAYKQISSSIDSYLKDFTTAQDSIMPIFAYASQELKAKVDGYDRNVEDMSFVALKENYFKDTLQKNNALSAKTEEALKMQAKEILPYLLSTDIKVQDQEEVESVFIRSIIALQILSEYGSVENMPEIMGMSKQLFSEMKESIKIRESENKYLDALNSGNEKDIEKYKEELDNKTEYVRRISTFQNVLLKSISDLAAKDISSDNKYSDSARDFLIDIASGETIDNSTGMEGIFWLKQLAIMRLKDFNSQETKNALKKIIEDEKSGKTYSPDSVFLARNLEASNVNTMSLILLASSVLIDFQRQEARETLLSNTDKYFEDLENIIAKDRFAYIIAAADILSNDKVSKKIKQKIFNGFASIQNEDILFASNILLDSVLNEMNKKRGRSTQYINAMTDFVETFAKHSVFKDTDRREIDQIIRDIKNKKQRKEIENNAEKLIMRIRKVLGNINASSTEKPEGWMEEYNNIMISGGGISEEVLKVENISMGNVAGFMTPNDDSGSSLLCRSFNADTNGIYSIAQGDTVNFMTKAAFSDESKAPLKNIIKDFMNYRLEDNTRLIEKINILKNELKLEENAAKEGKSKEFKLFWDKVIRYAEIIDSTGMRKSHNSLRNLIFEAIAIDNKAYGEGFINPDGIYSSMKDFADLIGTESVAFTNMPYGNILKINTKGGIEYLGQSYFSHTPHTVNEGMERDFFAAENTHYVFDEIAVNSRLSNTIEKAKVIIAGVSSWVTSLGIQLANKDIINALIKNKSADKILITNPVKDDESTMSWTDSTISFIQSITGTNTKLADKFNHIITWGKTDFDSPVGDSNFLKAGDVFDGKLGGYRGFNKPSLSAIENLKQSGINVKVVDNGLAIKGVPRRDDPSKTNYRVEAISDVLAKTIWGLLSIENKQYYSSKSLATFASEIKGSRFENANALIFAPDQVSLEKTSALSDLGINSFSFMPLSRSEIESRIIAGDIKPLSEYEHLSSPRAETELYFQTVENETGSIATYCYYLENKDNIEHDLAEWFIRETPSLLNNGLIKYEDISFIEMPASAYDTETLNIPGDPLKVAFVKDEQDKNADNNYDLTLPSAQNYNDSYYIEILLKGFTEKIAQTAQIIKHFQSDATINWNDLKANPQNLSVLKEFMQVSGYLDDTVSRASMIYAIKNKMDMQITNQGIFFIDSKGRKAAFYIDATGKFQSSEKYRANIEKLSELRIFADMDDNIAPRGKPFGEDMFAVFSALMSYGIGAPVIITGNTLKTIGVRYNELPEAVKEDIVFFTEVGSLQFAWNKETKSFEIAEEYLEYSGSEIKEGIRRQIRKEVMDIDVIFDDLYVQYIKDSLKGGQELVLNNLKAEYKEGNKYAEALKDLAELSSVEALYDAWINEYDLEKVSGILDKMEEKYKERALSNTDREKDYIEMLKLFSLLEYMRIYKSEAAEDQRNRAVVRSQDHIKEIEAGTYTKLEADSRVRVSLTPVRITHLKEKIADFYAEKLGAIDEFKDLKVESSGRTTINIMKKSINKTIPMRYFIDKLGLKPENIMYSGDEILKVGSSDATAGIDDSVALMNEEEYGGKMAVYNTSLGEHDTERRPNMVFGRGAFDNTGEEANSPVDIGVRIHKMFLDRLEYNIGEIAADENFEAENVIQVVKEVVAEEKALDFDVYDNRRRIISDDILRQGREDKRTITIKKLLSAA